MSEVTRQVRVINGPGMSGAYPTTETDAWETTRCPHCGGSQMVRVAFVADGNGRPSAELPRWLRCPSCNRAALIEDATLYPPVVPLREPLGLPDIDSRIWREARVCLGVGANSAAVMLCRKLLFHLAVSHGLEPKNSRDRAPSFTEAVSHLEGEGVITSKMRPWVDRIKDIGNDANHELAPMSPEQAMDVATFTEQLLVLAYELDALMANPSHAETS